MKKALTILAVLGLAVVGYMAFNGRSQAGSDNVPVVVFSEKLPDAWGKFQILKVDSVNVLLDATKDQALGDLPAVALVGQTVKIGCKDSWFGVSKTHKGASEPMEVHPAGDVISLEEDGRYTIVIIKMEGNTPKPQAVSYVLKATEKSLQHLLDEIRQKLREKSARSPGQSI